MLSSGELEPAYKMFDIVQKRRYEGFVYALSLLDKEMDFSAPAMPMSMTVTMRHGQKIKPRSMSYGVNVLNTMR